MQTDRPLHALAAMLAAQLCFSANILLLRFAEQKERWLGDPNFALSPWEPMLYRSLLLSAWCLYGLWRAPGRHLEGQERLWLWARGVAGVLSLSAYYYGVLHIPLGMASLFSNSSPLYVTLLAVVFSGDIISRTGLISLLGGFVGVAVVAFGAQEKSLDIAWMAVGVAALSGPLSAMAYFSIRQLKRIRSEQIMLSLGLAGLILSLAVLAVRGEHFPRTLAGHLWLLLSCLPALCAQTFLTRAFRSAPASQISPLQYTGPLFSSALAWLFLDERLPLISEIGIVIVIIFGLLLPYWQARKAEGNGLRSAHEPRR